MMAGPLDHQIMIGTETTYGTAVTPTRGYEWDLENSSHEWDPKVVQGTGMQVGDGAFPRASRSVSVIGQGSGAIGLDYQSKGMGMLVDAGCATGVATQLGATTGYQHLFTGALSGSTLRALTAQYGIVRSDSGGTVDAYTYSGVTVNTLTIACEAEDVLKLTAEWDAAKQTKATALATASYPAGLATPFHFGQITATVGGTIVVPTTTVMGSGGTAISDVKSFEFTLNNNADLDRWVFGGRNQPRVAQREATLSITTEYNSAVFDDAQVNHTTLPVTLTATSTDTISSGVFAQWQLVLPACKITSTNRPNPQAETPTVDYELAVRKPDTTGQAAFYIVHRTTDLTV